MVQADAQRLEEALFAADLPRFSRRDEIARGEIAPRLADSGRARDPQYRLQVAQSPRAFLDVGLEIGFLVARVPLLLLELLRFEKRAAVRRSRSALGKACEKLAVAGEEPRFQQRRLHGDVVPGHG